MAPRGPKVFVVNKQGSPLMPTTPRRARQLLKQGKARIYRYEPFFTIQLVYGASGYRQQVDLGNDPGAVSIGFSAVTEKEELLAGELTLVKGISERLMARSKYRRTRRQRKCRYRAKRFNNRPKKKCRGCGKNTPKKASGGRKELCRQHEGTRGALPRPCDLAPSIQHKLETHIRLVESIRAVLPIHDTWVEVCNFDIQLIKNSQIHGKDYQQGVQFGSDNLRNYVLHRDHHQCQNPDCKNQASQKILQVHHIGYWKKDRSDRPDNLITLCTRCHTSRHHQPGQLLHGWQPRVKSFRPETFMNHIRKRLMAHLQAQPTYGYITKGKRRDLKLPKSHANDAFVIAGGDQQTRAVPILLEQRRRNARSLETFYDAKYLDTRTKKPATGKELSSGRKTRNREKNSLEDSLRIFRGHKLKKGRRQIRTQRYPIQSGDVVRYNGQVHRVKGMQNYGRYIKLAGLTKPVKTELVTPVRWRKGICRMS